MHTRRRTVRLFLGAFALLISASLACGATFEDGAKSLFIGHSFFVPVAKKFDLLAKENGYSGHEAKMVFAGGSMGLPGALWSNPVKRKRIEEILSSGEIELFGMVSGGPRNAGYEDIARWIELALQYNPETVIFIGQPWVPGGPRAQTQRFDDLTTQGGDNTYTIVQQLRAAYPDTPIHFVNYGKTATEMRHRFDAGTLNDVNQLVGRRDGLFSDRMVGHGGRMLHDLAARVWLAQLYEAELQQIGYGPFDPQDAEEVTKAVIDFSRAYQ